jgi:hypothetical protein
MPGFLSKLEPTRPRIDWQLLQEERWNRMRKIMDEEGIDAIFTNKENLSNGVPVA